MPVLQPEPLLRALLDADVEFVVIGGLAVAFHGHVRATKDLDMCPSPARRNLERLAAALCSLDATQVGMEDFEEAGFPYDPLDPRDLARGGNFRLETRLGAVDIMQWVAGIPGELAYDQLAAGAIESTVAGMRLRFCGLVDLRRMKSAAGRPQDLDDLAHLPQG